MALHRLRMTAGFILDIIFPRRCLWCDAVLGFTKSCHCEALRESARRPLAPITDFEIEDWALAGVYAPFAYVQPVRSTMLRLKFAGQTELAAPLAAEMSALLSKTGLAQHYDLIVPAPVSAKTAKSRGYNQSALLARLAGNATGLPCCEDLLEKVRETEPQRSLPRAERLQNVKNAYRGAVGLSGKRVLLIDDIVTTGSTLNECAKAVLAAGAISCGALCLCATGHGADDGDEDI